MSRKPARFDLRRDDTRWHCPLCKARLVVRYRTICTVKGTFRRRQRVCDRCELHRLRQKKTHKQDARFRTPLIDAVLPYLNKPTHEAVRETLHRVARIIGGVTVNSEMAMCSRCDRIYRRLWPDRCECGIAFSPRQHPESNALRAALAAGVDALGPGARPEEVWRAAVFAIGGWLMDETSPIKPPRAKKTQRASGSIP